MTVATSTSDAYQILNDVRGQWVKQEDVVSIEGFWVDLSPQRTPQVFQYSEEDEMRELVQTHFVDAIKHLPGVYGVYFAWESSKMCVWTEIADYEDGITEPIHDAEDDLIARVPRSLEWDFFIFPSRPGKTDLPRGFVRLLDKKNA